MKSAGGAKAAQIRRPRFRLEYAAAFFIAAALLFFLYSVLQAGTGGQLTGSNSLGASLGGSARRSLVRMGTPSDQSTQTDAGALVAAKQPPCPEAKTNTVVKQETVTVTKLVYGSTVQNPRAYHVVTTTQGFSNHWQARIHYYWYKKQRDACLREPACDMGGFTRVLHSGKPDDLMDEIPTVVVDPLPPSVSGNTTYVVLNRPYAFIEWLTKVSIPEKYFVMCEADHLFLRPMPNLMNGESQGAAFFSYIVPWDYSNIVRKFIGNVSDEEVHKVPQIGNSPTFISREEALALFPIWYNTTLEIFEDKEAHGAWNWVLEMYGYSLATYRAGQHANMKVWPQMLAHPPFDHEELDRDGNPFYILHLTYPCMYDKHGNMTDNVTETVWKFDKREFGGKAPPRNLPPPPENVNNNLVRLIVAMVNEATDNIPCWDDYVATGKVTKCDKHAKANADAGVAQTVTTTSTT